MKRLAILQSLGLMALLLGTSANAQMQFNNHVGLEQRHFWQQPLLPQQKSNQTNVFIDSEIYWENELGSDSLTINPFYRYDTVDDNRSQFLFKQAYWLHLGQNPLGEAYEFSLGSKVVFWGVTESRHLVDIINPTDQISSPDGEDKLGQLMAQLSLIKDWGSIEFFVMPYFSQPKFQTAPARLRFPLLVTDTPLYQSKQQQKNIDLAMRINALYDDWEFGLNVFDGTSRSPDFIPNIVKKEMPTLTPFYRQTRVYSSDIQLTLDSSLWKFELSYEQQKKLTNQYTAIGLLAKNNSFFASTIGFEYTFTQALETQYDIGVLIEHSVDQRSQSVFQDNLFVATRWAFNDFSSSELLAGINFDLKHNSRSALIEANTRLGENTKLAVEVWWFDSDNSLAPSHPLRQDSFVQLELKYYF
ncbi:hypothetical protein [Psychrobium sp. 1_MG-2023]|uniref:hypothetical protein n=1 Tax=Psychrobium sp. 1_MG-2023 TaxID=3062624 RepID=UPI000C33EB30|nr:hypothetical protein [Psychrobium sp. 1_MG-2023]MDP2561157.1 hypothetical protein [Psychrobium sp. 1_MG-2023]PKF55131.1 hypothetical protein CW748_14305 [Alteromonadales bacterium alter-6D02]